MSSCLVWNKRKLDEAGTMRNDLPCVCVCVWPDTRWLPLPTVAATLINSLSPFSHVSSLCSLTIRSLTPSEYRVSTVSFPCVSWPCFAVTRSPRVAVCVFLLTLTEHWFLFLSAVGSAALHLYCFPLWSQTAQSQSSFHSRGCIPFLLSCLTFPSPICPDGLDWFSWNTAMATSRDNVKKPIDSRRS